MMGWEYAGVLWTDIVNRCNLITLLFQKFRMHFDFCVRMLGGAGS